MLTNAAAQNNEIAATFTISGSNIIDGYNLPSVPSGPVSFAANTYDASEGQYAKTENTGIHYGGSVENHAYGTSAADIEATSQFGFGVEDIGFRDLYAHFFARLLLRHPFQHRHKHKIAEIFFGEVALAGTHNAEHPLVNFADRHHH